MRGLAGNLQWCHGFAAAEFHFMHLAVTPDLQAQPVRQGVDYRNADAVQAAGDLVAVVVEFAAGVKDGHDHFGCRTAFFRVDVGRNAAAVVLDRYRVVRVDGDAHGVGMAGQCFVDRVVEHFEHHVMQAGAVGGVTDIHARALADCVESLQYLDTVCTVFLFAHCTTLCSDRSEGPAAAGRRTRSEPSAGPGLKPR